MHLNVVSSGKTWSMTYGRIHKIYYIFHSLLMQTCRVTFLFLIRALHFILKNFIHFFFIFIVCGSHKWSLRDVSERSSILVYHGYVCPFSRFVEHSTAEDDLCQRGGWRSLPSNGQWLEGRSELAQADPLLLFSFKTPASRKEICKNFYLWAFSSL